MKLIAHFLRVAKYLFAFIVLCLVALALFVLWANVMVLRNRPVESLSDLRPVEYALLLGTSKYTKSGMVNPYYRYRIEAAASLYKARICRKIIASGDNSSRYYNEPKSMRDDLVLAGVPKNAIVLDYAGLRTLDSVVRCKNLFRVLDPIIITQSFHAPRALYLAKSFGLDSAQAFSANSPASPSYRFRNASRESIARVKAFLDVNFLGTRPKFEK